MDSFPSTSGSEPQQHGIDDFDPHTGSFLGALQFMLQLFNDGVDAEEITVLFNNHNRPMPLSFVQQVVGGGDVPTGPTPDDTQQKRINLDMKILAFIIQMDRAGISVSVIQARVLAELGYFVREKFIREIVCEREIWDGVLRR